MAIIACSFPRGVHVRSYVRFRLDRWEHAGIKVG